MLLSQNFKLERIDSSNIALKKKREKNDRWDPIKYFSTWEEAIPKSIEHLTLNKIELSGGWPEVVTALRQLKQTVELVGKRSGLRIDLKEKAKPIIKRIRKRIDVNPEIFQYFLNYIEEVSRENGQKVSVSKYIEGLLLSYIASMESAKHGS